MFPENSSPFSSDCSPVPPYWIWLRSLCPPYPYPPWTFPGSHREEFLMIEVFTCTCALYRDYSCTLHVIITHCHIGEQDGQVCLHIFLYYYLHIALSILSTFLLTTTLLLYTVHLPLHTIHSPIHTIIL